MRPGVSFPVLLVLSLLCWGYLLHSLSGWVGHDLPHAQGTDRMMLQVASGIVVLILWALLGGLLLVAGLRGTMPFAVGAAAWIVHPLSCIAALAAIAVMYDPVLRWPAAVPAGVPLLVVGYAVYSMFPSLQVASPTVAGFTALGLILALSASVSPAVYRWRQAHADDSIEATPGPKLDAWMTRQRERRRAAGLEQLSQVNERTTLFELEPLTRGDSPVRDEALAAMRRLPGRQAEAVRRLEDNQRGIMPLVGELDLQPTAQLCQAGRAYLRAELTAHQRMFSEPVRFEYPILMEDLPGIRWLAAHCECKAEIEALERFARSQLDSPQRQTFLDVLAEIRRVTEPRPSGSGRDPR